MPLLRSLSATLLLACGFTAFFSPTIHASQLIDNLTAGRAQKLVVYGTSLTAGGQWVAETSAWLNARHPGLVTVVNSGMSGKASNSGVANLQAKVIGLAPDTVLIEFGMNDAFTAYAPTDIDYGITLAKCRENLNAMIDAILAAKPSTEIILQTMNQPWDAPNGNKSATKRPHLSAFYDCYRSVAAGRGLLLIDHHANWTRLQGDDPALFQSYLPDGTHPTAAASTAITLPAIKNALSASPAGTAPTGLLASPGNARVALSWNSVTAAAGYTVKRAEAAGGPFTTLASGLTTASYTDTGLVNNLAYRYLVSATDAAGDTREAPTVTAVPFAQAVLILDNADSSGVTITGTWTSSALAGAYNTTSLYAAANSGAGARFTPDLPAPGRYEVHARWTASSNRASNAPFTVAHADGSAPVAQNQQLNHGVWVSLGVFNFNAGTAGHVTLSSDGANGLVVADAVRFTQQPATALTFNAWSATQFTAAQRSDTAISGPLADPDGDSLSNLVEYALGQNPLAPGSASAPSTTSGDGHLTLIFPRRQTALDLDYAPEAGAALDSAAWSSDSANVEQTVIGDRGDGFSLVRARDLTVIGIAGTSRFLRLRVTKL